LFSATTCLSWLFGLIFRGRNVKSANVNVGCAVLTCQEITSGQIVAILKTNSCWSCSNDLGLARLGVLMRWAGREIFDLFVQVLEKHSKHRILDVILRLILNKLPRFGLVIMLILVPSSFLILEK
jgi:hypothetical protein